MVLGVRLQVLGELPDARRRERDLDLGRARVLLSPPVLGDHFALDFSLFCQTEAKLYRPSGNHRYGTISTLPSERGSAPARHAAGPSITIAWAWPRLWCPAGISSTFRPERLRSRASGSSASTEITSPPAWTRIRGRATASAGSSPRSTRLIKIWVCSCGWPSPPIDPNTIAGRPSRAAMAGISVCIVRFFGSSRLTCLGSSLKYAPRL